MHEEFLTMLVAIVMLGAVAQWLAWWLKLPSILFLLLFGLLAGPVGGWLDPDLLLGDLLFPFVSLGVAVVLFEGALTLRFRDIRGHGQVVSNLVTWGATLGWLLMAGGFYAFAGFEWPLALLFAALIVVTGPTVIIPLLRNVRPTPAVSQILRWEGILIDPIGAIFAVLVFELILSGFRGSSYLVILQELSTGVIAGVAGGYFLAEMLRRHLVPEYLRNVHALSTVLLVFAAANYFAHESGLLAVTVMGVWLANSKSVDITEILSFKETLSILIVSVLFIVLAARVDLDVFQNAGWTSAIVLAVVFAVRPVVVFLTTWHSELSLNEKLLLSWIAPRGIVAAAVSSLFALRLSSEGIPGADILASMTFLVIVATVVIQGLSARLLARVLGVAEEEPRGILILGADQICIQIGVALKKQGFRVKVAGTDWSEIQAARMAGLDTYFGNPVSVHADNHLDLIGIGKLFAMSRRPELNTLACLKFRNEFGRQSVFTLRSEEEQDQSQKNRVMENFDAPRLFGEEVTMQQLGSLLKEGAEVRVTTLTDEFTEADYRERYSDRVMPLFTIDDRGRLRAFTESYSPPLQNGYTIISLIPADKLPKTEQGD